MAIKIPLNKFRRVNLSIPDTLTTCYEAPAERASIVIQAQISNISLEDHTVSVFVSSGTDNTLFPIVSALEIPARDSRSCLTGRLVLQGIDGATILSPDSLVIQAYVPDVLFFTLSVLETKNTD